MKKCFQLSNIFDIIKNLKSSTQKITRQPKYSFHEKDLQEKTDLNGIITEIELHVAVSSLDKTLGAWRCSYMLPKHVNKDIVMKLAKTRCKEYEKNNKCTVKIIDGGFYFINITVE